MKRHLSSILLTIGLCLSSAAFAQGPAEFIERRIADLQRESDALRRESFELAGGQTIRQSITITNFDKGEYERRIASTEAAIEQVAGTRAEVERMRAELLSGRIISNEDVGQESVEKVAEDIALKGASMAAKRLALVLGVAIDLIEYGDRVRIAVRTLNHYDQILATQKLNLQELRDAATVFYVANGQQIRKLRRLRVMEARESEIWKELAMLKANQEASQKPPPPLPPRVLPGRETDAAGDEALREQARREAMRVGKADPKAILASELAGYWMATGYNCVIAQPAEQLHITYSAEEGLVAVKITGDNCVRAKEVTWRGVLKGRTIHARIRLREPNAPLNTGRWMEGTLEVISRDEIRGLGLTIRRR